VLRVSSRTLATSLMLLVLAQIMVRLPACVDHLFSYLNNIVSQLVKKGNISSLHYRSDASIISTAPSRGSIVCFSSTFHHHHYDDDDEPLFYYPSLRSLWISLRLDLLGFCWTFSSYPLRALGCRGLSDNIKYNFCRCHSTYVSTVSSIRIP